jgi:UDP-N-acetylglucosamine/UDP-N-acetylgalactosamine diphosphorylase
MIHVSEKVQVLLKRGAKIPRPTTIHIDQTVDISRLAPDITIHPGCRITGKTTSIGPGCVIGEEGPVTLADCQLADNVMLKGGSFSGSVFLSGSRVGPCAHIREATILEEQASCAHAVGLKQTILMPYVTLGSLVNFCDCLMAGGTGRKDHSEVGSSYVHFNYTPHKDKATASLIGDVPRGVMLNQRPIFLGGQGGLVGPARIEYGAIVAAGTICRRDVLEGSRLVFGSSGRTSGDVPCEPALYGDINRTLSNNFIYIGNLHALYCWYTGVRSLFVRNKFEKACRDGAINVLQQAVKERIKRLSGLVDNINLSIETAHKKFGKKLPAHPFNAQKMFITRWSKLAYRLELGAIKDDGGTKKKTFLMALEKTLKPTYLETIKTLQPAARKAGTEWLKTIADSISSLWDV